LTFLIPLAGLGPEAAFFSQQRISGLIVFFWRAFGLVGKIQI
jgi:hypothetical protein